MRKLSIYIIALIISTLTSCSPKILFTNEIKQKLEEKELDINRVQFYNSKKIVLTRELPHDVAIIKKGTIRLENGKVIEQIIVKKSTPGVCDFWNENEMDITFEYGDGKYLKFYIDDYGKYFQLLTENEQFGYNSVFYDTTFYEIQRGGERTRLMVRKNEDYILRVNQRVAKGQVVR